MDRVRQGVLLLKGFTVGADSSDVVERFDDPTGTAGDGTGDTPAPPVRTPLSFDFKLRLTSPDHLEDHARTASTDKTSTDETSTGTTSTGTTSTGTTSTGTTSTTPWSGAEGTVELRPADWEQIAVARPDEPRRYQSDGDLQSLIVELANQIAGPDTTSTPVVRVTASATIETERRPQTSQPDPTPAAAPPESPISAASIQPHGPAEDPAIAPASDADVEAISVAVAETAPEASVEAVPHAAVEPAPEPAVEVSEPRSAPVPPLAGVTAAAAAAVLATKGTDTSPAAAPLVPQAAPAPADARPAHEEAGIPATPSPPPGTPPVVAVASDPVSSRVVPRGPSPWDGSRWDALTASLSIDDVEVAGPEDSPPGAAAPAALHLAPSALAVPRLPPRAAGPVAPSGAPGSTPSGQGRQPIPVTGVAADRASAAPVTGPAPGVDAEAEPPISSVVGVPPTPPAGAAGVPDVHPGPRPTAFGHASAPAESDEPAVAPSAAPLTIVGNAPPIGPPAEQRPVPAGAPSGLNLAAAPSRTAGRTGAVDFHALLGQAGLASASTRRKKRRPFRFLLKLVIVLGIIGAGAYFGKIYVLDQRWDAELKPFAEAVANERGLEWKRAVRAEELPAEEYAARLATGWLGIDADEVLDLAAEWRAMGLVEGELSLDGIGAAAIGTRPAFYDPADRTIYVAAGTPVELRELALDRALAMALLDQHHGWSEGWADRDLGERTALLTLFDGDASATAFALAATDAAGEEQLVAQVLEVRDQHAGRATGAPRYAADLLSAGGGTRFLFEGLAPDRRDALLDTGISSDAGVFDVARPLDQLPVDLLAEPGETRGLAYWYYVLAGRVPSDQAWEAALAWQGDRVVRVTSGPVNCVQATIATAPEAQPVLLAALQQWQAASPSDAGTTVTAPTPDQLSVVSCDPGAAADTVVVDDVAVFGDSIAETRLVGMTGADDTGERACVVRGVRGYDITAVLASGDTAAIDDAVAALRESCVT